MSELVHVKTIRELIHIDHHRTIWIVRWCFYINEFNVDFNFLWRYAGDCSFWTDTEVMCYSKTCVQPKEWSPKIWQSISRVTLVDFVSLTQNLMQKHSHTTYNPETFPYHLQSGNFLIPPTIRKLSHINYNTKTFPYHLQSGNIPIPPTIRKLSYIILVSHCLVINSINICENSMAHLCNYKK